MATLALLAPAARAIGAEGPALPPQPTATRAGEALYQTACVACHGVKGDGNGPAAAAPAPDFTTPAAVGRLSDERMLEAMRRGHDARAAALWQARSDEELMQVAAYVRESFMLPSAVADVNLGKRLYARNCSVCHGDRGDGASWARNSLNPPPFDFTALTPEMLPRLHMIEIVTQGQPGTAMVGFANRLAPPQIEAVVDYVRGAFMVGRAPAEAAREPLRRSSTGTPPAPATAAAAAPPHAGHDHGGPDLAAPIPFGLAGDRKRGAALYGQNCVPCHGEAGDGAGPRAYFINPKPANFTSAAARSSFGRAHLFEAIGKGVNGSEMPAWEKVLTPQQIADLAEYVFNAFIAAPGDSKKN